MFVIKNIQAIEILDSRGRPTLLTKCVLNDGTEAKASVPSGASTGKSEALELRDGDSKRFGGLGCQIAIGKVNQEINAALASQTFASQQALDQALIDLDGTGDKSNLGANAILSVSLAFARAVATTTNTPLYQYFAGLDEDYAAKMPGLTINLFSGGKHAGQQVSIQDVLIVPLNKENMQDRLAIAYDVYQSAAKLVFDRYQMRLLTADEGGLAPPVDNDATLLAHVVQAIENAGYRAGEDVALAIDVAASHFYDANSQTYLLGEERLSSAEMVGILQEWQKDYPIISIEDGLAEDDWENWPRLCQALKNKALVLGDDLLCTNPQRIQKAIDEDAANALLLKVNQIGTISEALQANRLARKAKWHVVISARSGETEDNWLADLATGWAGDYIKVGSINQSERLSKYNRLLEIEAGF
jgi:enolase